MNGEALLLMVVYTASYLTRINFGAVVLEMAQDTGWSNELLSMALTGSFITYGVGQLISGALGDRFQPRNLVLIGLTVSGIMNAAIPFCHTAAAMTVIWCINGFCQSLLWPPLVKFMVSMFSAQEYPRVTMLVALGSPIGTMLVYLAAPLWIGFWGWQSVFWICALCGWAVALLWFVRAPRIETQQRRSDLPAESKGSFFSPMLLMILLAILMQGTLRDGVATWMPSYVSESYGLGSQASIFTGVLMPLFSIGCYQASSMVYRRFPGNPPLCAGGFFGVAAVSSLLLVLVAGKYVLGSVFFMALLTGCMHGANLMLIGMIPAFYRQSGRVSFVSGLLNACTYVGSALSTYGVAWLSERAGWSAALHTWAVCALLGFAFCMCSAPLWSRKFLDKKK